MEAITFTTGTYSVCRYADSACSLNEVCMSLAASVIDSRDKFSGSEIGLTYFVDTDNNGLSDIDETDIFIMYAKNYPCTLINEHRSSSISAVTGSLSVPNYEFTGSVYRFSGCGNSRKVQQFSETTCDFVAEGCVPIGSNNYMKMSYDGKEIECLAYVDPDLNTASSVSVAFAVALGAIVAMKSM
eukprot:GDKJ01036179.1.p1 GENE.GDKJ01036179.1~~GDKJ01036179.1.p1  ORF type:complete len:185 (+),score=13.37 GDKJ01036179.1:39-593(+)